MPDNNDNGKVKIAKMTVFNEALAEDIRDIKRLVNKMYERVIRNESKLCVHDKILYALVGGLIGLAFFVIRYLLTTS